MERAHLQKANSTAQISNGSVQADTPSPALDTRSTLSSQSSGFSLSNFCHKITSWVQRGWNWLKENILKIKKSEAAPVKVESASPSLSQLARFDRNLMAVFRTAPEQIIHTKDEDPKKFLEMVVDQALRTPQTFFHELLVNRMMCYADGSERTKLIEFLERVGWSLGDEGKLTNRAPYFFSNDPIIREHAQKINQFLAIDENQEKVRIMKAVYKEILG